MVKGVANRGEGSFQMASSHLVTTCATLAALILFVLVGAKVVPSAIGLTKAGQPAMVVAFLLNIAIILFGWRRAALGSRKNNLAPSGHKAAMPSADGAIIEVLIGDVVVRAPADVDEAHLQRVIRAVRSV